ncbi:MAG: DUF6364 family protein [Bacteroidota bacterium]|nr:DUF6364 family protein [Bacteroidota bacterium]MDP4233991.1 DUF6364 family protein [Bacteroidota bacterium]MDP4242858.1 DUF6364 family protein [Bacteroidota bacterium]MDP4287704.1 DUF6364 family protein [Bacteroidota bacterium]
MKTLQIPFVDDSLIEKLKRIADRERSSVSDVIRRYLEQMVASHEPPANGATNKNAILASTRGTWSASQYSEFDQNTAPFREIDPSLWQ